MKQATVNQSFHDLKEGTFRKAGGVFLVDDERGLYLAQLGLVSLKDVAPEKKRATPKRKRV